ncbi:MAG TPA: hypothetical protein VL994_03435 [Steroidobacteraceae bacterium]|nr:hypothetical protein [Steroidobacteraceae bacterium]
MRKILAVAGLAVLLALAGGCKTLRGANACHKPQPYQAATSIPLLKIPQGLDAPDTANALKLPTLNEPPPPPRGPKEPCLDQPPPFKVAKPAPAPQA